MLRIHSSVDSSHLWLRRVYVCTCKFWLLITVQFRQKITITTINFNLSVFLGCVSWQYQLSIYVVCLALLPTVIGNCGAGILQLSRPRTLVGEKSFFSRWEIVIFQNGEVKIVMVFRYLQKLCDLSKEAIWVIPFYGSVCLGL